MKRDVALRVFDELILHGFDPTLSSFHGTTIEQGPTASSSPRSKQQPVYDVTSRSRTYDTFNGVELETIAAVAEMQGVNFYIEGNGHSGVPLARFAERSS